MRNELKTAMITVIIIVVAIGGVGYYFTTLDKQKENTLPIQETSNQKIGAMWHERRQIKDDGLRWLRYAERVAQEPMRGRPGAMWRLIGRRHPERGDAGHD